MNTNDDEKQTADPFSTVEMIRYCNDDEKETADPFSTVEMIRYSNDNEKETADPCFHKGTFAL